MQWCMFTYREVPGSNPGQANALGPFVFFAGLKLINLQEGAESMGAGIGGGEGCKTGLVFSST